MGKLVLGKMALGKMAGWIKWRRVKWHWVKWNWVNCHVTEHKALYFIFIKYSYERGLRKILNCDSIILLEPKSLCIWFALQQ